MRKLNVALVAHDARKEELMKWVEYNFSTLKEHNIYATGMTGKRIERIDGYFANKEENDNTCNLVPSIKVNKLLRGNVGGDQQIGSMIAEGKIDVLIFLCDNITVQRHQQDIDGLIRLASLYNIAFATNITTADMIISSPLFANEEYYSKK